MTILQRAQALLVGTTLTAALVCSACSTGERRSQTQPVPPPIGKLDGTAYQTAMRVQLPKVPPEDEHGLHNVYHLSESIVSGSEPRGEEAFQKLQEMGVRTILSVDGKLPDEELAARYGMRYVHVPIQYKGISQGEMLRIAKTFREQEGPFYVHCFHGKHRGPAAAEVGRIVLDGIPRDQALAEMRQWCGTAESYEGLYLSIAEGSVPDEPATRAFDWDFPAAQPLQGFRQGMIEVSRADDNSKYLSKRNWQPDAEHPDVDALNEATKLASALERCARLEEVASRPADFRGWMDEAVKGSAALRDALSALQKSEQDRAPVDQAYKRVSSACNACHDAYRND